MIERKRIVIEERIVDLLDEKFGEEEFADCFLVDMKLHPSRRLQVFVDSDSGMTFEKCQRLSRHLEKYLDEEAWPGQKYVLEVSSPGVDRPLKFRRQYPKNIGRKVKVKLAEGREAEGTLTAADESGITLEEKVRRKVGKRKKTELVSVNIPYEEIEETIVKVSF